MPIEIPKEAYKILRRLADGERLFGIPGDGLTYEFTAGNIKTHADSVAAGYLLHKEVSQTVRKQCYGVEPPPSGKKNPKRY